jgi:hypothetical protein
MMTCDGAAFAVGGVMSFWAVGRLQPGRERLALHCLGLAGYRVYLPRLREKRVVRGRSDTARPRSTPSSPSSAVDTDAPVTLTRMAQAMLDYRHLLGSSSTPAR